MSVLATDPGSAAASGRAGEAPPPALQHLEPGGTVDLAIDIPVTVVYVGLEEGPPPTGINAEGMVEWQPTSSRVQEWRAHWAGEPSDLGIEYRYDVRPVFADQAFEDAFFGYLASSGYGPFGPTPVQSHYSGLVLAAEQITENLVLDATAVESWLIEHAPSMLGVDTTRPTVFFLNWYGRPDFQFHTYTQFTYQPEVDYFAPQWTRNHTIAWGGGVPDVPQAATSSLGRVWFMDVSAGPDLNTWNFLLDVGDVDGDGFDDNRIPPIWEYGTDHWFQPFDDLGFDLTAVLRFVAINLLFTPGPLYDPGISAPLLDDALELDLNVFEKQPDGAVGGVVADEILRRFGALDPSRAFTTDIDMHPFTPALDRAYECSSTPGPPDPRYCQPGNQAHSSDFEGNVLDLLIWATDHENEYLDGERGEIPVALFDVDTDRYLRWSGVSYDQRWNLVWATPLARRVRRSPTYTIVHEVGHHLGVRHPHDGYDWEWNLWYGAGADFFIARLGDESATLMSHLYGQVDFSQFDRDNLDRFLVAARFQAADDILGDIYASPRASHAATDLRRADELAGLAIDQLHGWDLRGASIASRDAYHAVLDAAAKAGVHVEPRSATADARSRGPWWTDDSEPDARMPFPELRQSRVEGLDDPAS